ncbi:MAG: hypothetical protein ACRD2A_06330, partial [Vicinamibacterales bacterium]
MPDAVVPDVYSASEIAAAAGTTEARVEFLISRGQIRSVAALAGATQAVSDAFSIYVSHDEAVRVVRALRSGSSVGLPDALGLGRELFADARTKSEPRTTSLVVSTSLHAVVAATIFIASLSFASANEPTLPIDDPEPIRLVYLAIPGPGGGGGGSGFRMPQPAPKAERKGPAKLSSPLPARQLPPPIRPVPKPPEPPKPLEAKQLPPV